MLICRLSEHHHVEYWAAEHLPAPWHGHARHLQRQVPEVDPQHAANPDITELSSQYAANSSLTEVDSQYAD
jgi:hypothetical protein